MPFKYFHCNNQREINLPQHCVKHCNFFSLKGVLLTLYFLLISEFLNVKPIELGFFVHLYKTSNVVMIIYNIYVRECF